MRWGIYSQTNNVATITNSCCTWNGVSFSQPTYLFAHFGGWIKSVFVFCFFFQSQKTDQQPSAGFLGSYRRIGFFRKWATIKICGRQEIWSDSATFQLASKMRDGRGRTKKITNTQREREREKVNKNRHGEWMNERKKRAMWITGYWPSQDAPPAATGAL